MQLLQFEQHREGAPKVAEPASTFVSNNAKCLASHASTPINWAAMNTYAAYKHYSESAKTADTPTWRTIYTLGLMCAAAVNYGNFVAFVGDTGYGSDWPDPRLATSSNHLRRRDD